MNQSGDDGPDSTQKDMPSNQSPAHAPTSPGFEPGFDLPAKLIGPNEYGVPTLWDSFLRGYNKASMSNPCLGSRLTFDSSKNSVPSPKYSWLSYLQVYQKLRAISIGLSDLVHQVPYSELTQEGVKNVIVGLEQARVAVWCPNRPIWTITEYACYRNSIAVVSINDQATSQAASEITDQIKPQVVILTAEKFKRLIKHRARATQQLIPARQPHPIEFQVPSVGSPGLESIPDEETITLLKEPVSDNFSIEAESHEDHPETSVLNASVGHSTRASSSRRKFSIPSSSTTSNPTYDKYHNVLHQDPTYVLIDANQISKRNESEAIKLGITMFDIEEVEEMGHIQLQKLPADIPVSAEVEDLIEAENKNLLKPRAETIAAIIYSSGTTGDPKACLITHGNFAANLASFHRLTEQKLLPELQHYELVQYSYLPLSHIYEKLSQAFVLYNGGSIGFSSILGLRFLEDITSLKPTFLSTTPQFLSQQILDNRLNSLDNFSSFKSSVESYFLTKAIEEKIKVLKQGYGEKVWLWDKFVLGYLRERLGGRLKWIVSGTSALSAHAIELLSASLSVKISEGYGLTETCSAASISLVEDSSTLLSGGVGIALPCCEIKLVDVKGFYTAEDRPYPRGEIHIRGHNVFAGYFIPRTARSGERIHSPHNSEGWIATGDAGYFDQSGRLFIIDRLINSTSPTVKQQIHHQFNSINFRKIELILLNSMKEIGQIFISSALEDPSPNKNCGQLGHLSAYVVVQVPEFLRWLQSEDEAWKALETGENEDEADRSYLIVSGDSNDSFEIEEIDDTDLESVESVIAKLCRDPKVTHRFLNQVRLLGKLNGLKLYELPTRVYLTTKPLLTSEMASSSVIHDSLEQDTALEQENLLQTQSFSTIKLRNDKLRQHFLE